MTVSATRAGGVRRAPLGRLLSAELNCALRRPRTLVTLGLLALVPALLGAGLADSWSAEASGASAVPGLISATTKNGLMLPVTALAVGLSLLLPLVVSIAAADALAGEVAHGSLRALLLAPISRPRAVGIKAVGVLAVAALAVLVIVVVGLLAGMAVGGGGQLLTLSGTTVGVGSALARVGIAAGWTLLQVCAVGAVALAVSALTDHPLVATAMVLSGAIGFGVLASVPSLTWLRPLLLTSDWSDLVDVLRDPLPAESLIRSALLAVVYLVVGLTVAVIGTMRREV